MSAEGLAFEITRVLPAERTVVFRAMTDANVLAEWWGPDGFHCPRLDFEPREGRGYRIAMQPPEGELFHLEGEFVEVESPGRLSFSFRWDPPDPDDRETVARLTLVEREAESPGGGAETEVTLRQGPFATEERRDLHAQGWSESFEKLDAILG
jgi:uncharacterized protein YndB with AHSA1/START domain